MYAANQEQRTLDCLNKAATKQDHRTFQKMCNEIDDLTNEEMKKWKTEFTLAFLTEIKVKMAGYAGKCQGLATQLLAVNSMSEYDRLVTRWERLASASTDREAAPGWEGTEYLHSFFKLTSAAIFILTTDTEAIEREKTKIEEKRKAEIFGRFGTSMIALRQIGMSMQEMVDLVKKIDEGTHPVVVQ